MRQVELRLAPTLLDPSLVLVIQDTLAMESRARVSSRPRPQSKSPADQKKKCLFLLLLDINECTAGTANCATGGTSTCTNTPGSYTCACNTGYSGNGVTCTGMLLLLFFSPAFSSKRTDFYYLFILCLQILMSAPWEQTLATRLSPPVKTPQGAITASVCLVLLGPAVVVWFFLFSFSFSFSVVCSGFH